MSKVYISPYDFTPRTAGELRLAKDDHIILSDIGNGWCWGKNITQGGHEGVFPKRYLSRPGSGMSGFNSAVDEVASVCSRMDMFIARSPHLTSARDRASLLGRQAVLRSLGPFSYLTSGCPGPIWEACLQNLVSAFAETRVRPHEYLRCLENLRRLAGMLDRRVPRLSEEARRCARVLPSALRNAECMQATMKGLLATAVAALDWYGPSAGGTFTTTTTTPSSPRGPGPDPEPVARTAARPSPPPPEEEEGLPLPLARVRPGASRPAAAAAAAANLLLLGYPALQALTFLVCIVACALQLRAYALAPHEPGGLDDPDFYNNLQSVLMQLLTTYTGLVPAVRGGGGGGGSGSSEARAARGLASALWLSLLSVAGAALNLAAAGIYFRDGAMAPLLGFFGNAVQALTVLQLAISLDNARGAVAVMVDEV